MSTTSSLNKYVKGAHKIHFNTWRCCTDAEDNCDFTIITWWNCWQCFKYCRCSLFRWIYWVPQRSLSIIRSMLCWSHCLFFTRFKKLVKNFVSQGLTKEVPLKVYRNLNKSTVIKYGNSEQSLLTAVTDVMVSMCWHMICLTVTEPVGCCSLLPSVSTPAGAERSGRSHHDWPEPPDGGGAGGDPDGAEEGRWAEEGWGGESQVDISTSVRPVLVKRKKTEKKQNMRELFEIFVALLWRFSCFKLYSIQLGLLCMSQECFSTFKLMPCHWANVILMIQ